MTHFDVNYLGLYAPEGDLGHVFAKKNLFLQVLGVFLKFLERIAVAVYCVEQPVYVAEIVVDNRRPGAGRQLALNITHLAAQLIPNLRQLARRKGALHLGVDDRKAFLRHGANFLELAHRLYGAFDDVGHFLFDFFGRGAGVGCAYNGRFDNKIGVLETA